MKTPERRLKPRPSKLLAVGRTVLVLAAVVAVWQLAYWLLVEKTGAVKAYVFPCPSGIVQSYAKLIANGTLLAGIGQSLRRIAVGYGISVAVGLGAGLLLSACKGLGRALKPLLLGVQTLPSVCWVPFAILWYGLAESATVFIVVIGSAFSICIAAESGISQVNPLYIRAARTMGAKGVGLYTRVILPASVPALVGALRQGWSFAWRALMTGEMMMSSKGVGLMLSQAREIGGVNEVAAVMLVIIVISVLIDKLIFGLLEKRVSHMAG